MSNMQILFLTLGEKSVLDILNEVQVKCLDKSNGPRFTQDGVIEALRGKGIPEVEWGSLKKKLLSLKIIQIGGTGKRGQIFNLNQDLFLKYSMDKNLVKITIWREEQVQPKPQRVVAVSAEERDNQIFEIQQSIQKKIKDLEIARMEVEDLEQELSNLEKRLKNISQI